MCSPWKLSSNLQNTGLIWYLYNQFPFWSLPNTEEQNGQKNKYKNIKKKDRQDLLVYLDLGKIAFVLN